MTFSQNHSNFLAENNTNKPSFSILFSGIVMPDGYGDLGHFKDFYGTFLKNNQDTSIQSILLLAYFEDKKEKIFSMLKEYQLISENTLMSDNPLEINQKNPQLFLMAFVREEMQLKNDEFPRYAEEEHRTWLRSPVYQAALKNVRIIFNISNAGMLEKFKDPEYKYNEIFLHQPRIIHFPEIGAKLNKHYSYLTDNQYAMGFKEGMFFNLQKNTDISIQEESFLSILLDVPIEKLQDNVLCQSALNTFRENTLFFPSYFKSRNSFYLYMLAFLRSPLCKENSGEIVIFVNIYYEPEANKGYETPLISLDNLDLLHYVYQTGINQLTYTTREKKINIALNDLLISHGCIPKCAIPNHKKFKKLRIIHTKVSSHDFEEIFKLAKYVGGCSGDRSLSNCIENLLMPLFEIRSYKVKELSEELMQLDQANLFYKTFVECAKIRFAEKDQACIWNKDFDKQSKGTPIIELLSLEELSSVADSIAKDMTLDNINELKEFLSLLIKNKNLFNLLPTIFNKEINLALQSKSPINHHSLFSNASSPTLLAAAPHPIRTSTTQPKP